MEFIDLKSQYNLIKNSLLPNLEKALAAGQFIMGPEVKQLETELAKFTGAKYCSAVGNGTDALQIALMALGIGLDDEVITTSFSYIATAEAISVLKAKPVLIDVEESTFNMNITQLESKINSKTKAIIPVSLFGQTPNFKEINRIAEKYGITVIEDAAQSFGASQDGVKSCNLSTIGCTSFFPSKPLGCYGDGGAIFTSDENLAKKISMIRVHGQEKKYHHEMLGLNSRLDTLQAVVLQEKMKLFSEEVNLRNIIAKKYDEGLQTHYLVPKILPQNISVYAQYTLIVKDREELAQFLKGRGIPTMVYYPVPIHLQKAFSYLGYKQGDFQVSEKLSDSVISIPMSPYILDSEINFIIDCLIEFAKGKPQK
jgi:UDP-2-acetamido-2-deoxy-ribo-hexuluronate aminotransferase